MDLASFMFGIFIGANVGLIAAALLGAAKRGDTTP